MEGNQFLNVNNQMNSLFKSYNNTMSMTVMSPRRFQAVDAIKPSLFQQEQRQIDESDFHPQRHSDFEKNMN